MCPPKSFLGGGNATVHAPGPVLAARPVGVGVQRPRPGPAAAPHFSPDLGPASPIVDARIVKATRAEQRQGFGQALSVPQAPVTGALKITSFNAKILKSKKVASAKCKPKKFKMKRTVTYTDGSSESVSKSQKCKVRRKTLRLATRNERAASGPPFSLPTPPRGVGFRRWRQGATRG